MTAHKRRDSDHSPRIGHYSMRSRPRLQWLGRTEDVGKDIIRTSMLIWAGRFAHLSFDWDEVYICAWRFASVSSNIVRAGALRFQLRFDIAASGNGSSSEYVAAPEANCLPLPEALSFETDAFPPMYRHTSINLSAKLCKAATSQPGILIVREWGEWLAASRGDAERLPGNIDSAFFRLYDGTDICQMRLLLSLHTKKALVNRKSWHEASGCY